MNPVIYSIFNTEFRDAFKKILVSYVHNECCNDNYRRSSRGVHDPLVSGRPSFGGPGVGNSTYQLGQQNTSLTVTSNTPSGIRKTKNTITSEATEGEASASSTTTAAATASTMTTTTTAATTITTNVTSVKRMTPQDILNVDSRSLVSNNYLSDLDTSNSKISPSENGMKLSATDAQSIVSTANTLSINSAHSCIDKSHKLNGNDDDNDMMKKEKSMTTDTTQVEMVTCASLLTKDDDDDEEDETANFDQTTSHLIPSTTIDRNIELSFYSRTPCNDHEKTSVTSTLAV